MSERNVNAIRTLYAAFGAGDIPTALSMMSPDIVWHEAENFPYADGNPYIGPEAVLNGVFARCATEWEGFGVVMEQSLDAGDHVVASGRYRGTWPATGRAMRPQVVHIWRMVDGKAIAFQQHIDTLEVARAMGAA